MCDEKLSGTLRFPYGPCSSSPEKTPSPGLPKPLTRTPAESPPSNPAGSLHELSSPTDPFQIHTQPAAITPQLEPLAAIAPGAPSRRVRSTQAPYLRTTPLFRVQDSSPPILLVSVPLRKNNPEPDALTLALPS